MLRVLTAEQAREIERRAVAEVGASLDELMLLAGTAVATAVHERVPTGRVVVLAGPGNNGGDGWVAARVLHAAGRMVEVLTLRDPGALADEAARAAAEAIASGVSWRSVDAADPLSELSGADCIVDAVLGTGSGGPLRPPVDAWCAAINSSGAFVVAVDLPTGVDADRGGAVPNAVVADCTVTFSAPKIGLVVYPGAGHAGEIVVEHIGIPERFYASLEGPELWHDDDYRAALPVFAADVHKNSRGRVLVVAGSGRFPGAAVLAARGAMRMGAGYVTLAVPEPVAALAQAHVVAAPVVGLPASRSRTLAASAAHAVAELAADHDAVVIGPGLTLADGAVATVRSVLARVGKPLVVDADALNALVDAHDVLMGRSAPAVLTPHPGELARLLGTTIGEVQADRVSSSARLTGAGRTVLLKGAGSIASGDGRQVVITAGSPALATAGTGDVLSGMIGTLLSQGLSPLTAAALGAHLHARAGEEAAADLTPYCVTAEDLPDYVPHAAAALLESW